MKCPGVSRPAVACLAAGLLLGAVGARSSAAQSPPPGSVCAAPAAPPVPPVPDPPADGWLILHGQLVPGPYTVTVANDTVQVNGNPFALANASPPATLGPGAHQALFDQFWSLWHTWCDGGCDQAAAAQQALVWWQSQPGVAGAAINPPGSIDLHIQFSGDPNVEVVVLELPDDSNQPSDSQARADYLADLAQQVDDALRHGRLLIVEDEGYMFIAAPGESGDLMAQIEQIAALPSADQRFQALRPIIPDEQMASSIAQRFGTGHAGPRR